MAGIDVSKENVERLKADMPAVTIEWTEPNEVYQRRIRALFGKN
jgi:hypothetical protein